MQSRLNQARIYSIALACSAAMLTGCLSSTPTKTEEKSSDKTASTSKATTSAQPAKGKSASTTTPENSADKKETSGKEVKGINGWTGNISGTPAKNSKFSRLKIGMSPRQVTNLIGQPTDESNHVTGKAFIPFYYGSGGSETIYFYKGQGRLYFANNHAFSGDRGLVLIEHDGSEDGYNN